MAASACARATILLAWRDGFAPFLAFFVGNRLNDGIVIEKLRLGISGMLGTLIPHGKVTAGVETGATGAGTGIVKGGVGIVSFP